MWLQMLAAATNNPGHTESPPQPGGSLRSKEALEERGSAGEKTEQGPTWGKGLSYRLGGGGRVEKQKNKEPRPCAGVLQALR